MPKRKCLLALAVSVTVIKQLQIGHLNQHFNTRKNVVLFLVNYQYVVLHYSERIAKIIILN